MGLRNRQLGRSMHQQSAIINTKTIENRAHLVNVFLEEKMCIHIFADDGVQKPCSYSKAVSKTLRKKHYSFEFVVANLTIYQAEENC